MDECTYVDGVVFRKTVSHKKMMVVQSKDQCASNITNNTNNKVRICNDDKFLMSMLSIAITLISDTVSHLIVDFDFHNICHVIDPSECHTLSLSHTHSLSIPHCLPISLSLSLSPYP